MSELGTGVLASIAFGALGTLLLGLGFVLVDLVTPGKLRELIWKEGNRNASILLASRLLGIGIIITTAIVTSNFGIGDGLLTTLIYSLIGLALTTGATLLLDLATPGDLGKILVSPQPHPAVWVSAAIHISLSSVVAASIS